MIPPPLHNLLPTHYFSGRNQMEDIDAVGMGRQIDSVPLFVGKVLVRRGHVVNFIIAVVRALQASVEMGIHATPLFRLAHPHAAALAGSALQLHLSETERDAGANGATDIFGV